MDHEAKGVVLACHSQFFESRVVKNHTGSIALRVVIGLAADCQARLRAEKVFPVDGDSLPGHKRPRYTVASVISFDSK